MTPKLSIIAASIRKALGGLAGDIGKYADEYWNSVVLALRGSTPVQDFKNETVLNMHMDGADPDWGSVVLGMHMGGGEVDPYWSNVSLLMLMNGTNGSTAIGDVTGKTVTVVGNAAISTTQSKFGGSSCYFDGTGDYLTLASSSSWNFGTGDFTVEAWVNLSSLTGTRTVFNVGNYQGSGAAFYILAAGQLAIYRGAGVAYTGSGVLSTGVWTHVAFSRVSGTVTGYVNGVSQGSVSFTADISDTSLGSTVGTGRGGGGYDAVGMHGYIDNLRITKGIARYTDNFTPPNREFPAGATTIYDVKGHPVTVAGNTAIVATQSRFGGYSAYFDGAGDYLETPTTAEANFGTGDFTVECWVNSQSISGTYIGAIGNTLGAASGHWRLGVRYNSTNSLSFTYHNGSSWVNITSGTDVNTSTWVHIAVARSGTTLKLFANGAQVYTGTHSDNIGNATAGFRVGYNSADSTYYTGFLDDLRVTKGVAKYTATFTPPTRAFPHDVAFFDEKGLVPTVTGAPTISTATLKYGYGSATFNGTTDYLTFDASSTFGLGTNDFTIEAWVKTSAAGTLLDFRNYASDYGHFYLATGGYLAFDHTYGAIIGTTTVTDNAWHHVAFVRYKNILTLYVDGVDTGAAIANANIGSNRQARVGAKVDSTNFFAGNIDELRVTKGVARYVGEFTPQRYQFEDANNNQIWRDETGLNSVTANGNAQVYSATSKLGNASMYFDGTGDGVVIPASTNFSYGTGDFTVEAWVFISGDSANASGMGRYASICCSGNTTSKDFEFVIAGDASVTGTGLSIGNGTVAVSATTSISKNTWHHIAVARQAGVAYLFVDGAKVGEGALTASMGGSTYPVYLGMHTITNYNFYLNGFLDDLRITKGVARYVSNFTPPARQNANYGLPALYDPYWDAVVLGLHMDGADNGTTFTDVKGNTVTANGNAKTVTATKKFGTASAYFDGAGDYLTVTDSTDFNFGSGDFTVECWFYETAAGVIRQLVGQHSTATYANSNFIILSNSQKVEASVFYGPSIITIANTSTHGLNAWHHVALVRNGSNILLYLDGALVASNSTLGANSLNNSTQVLSIGVVFNTTSPDPGGYYFTGYIDDLRITRGVARYTSNVQPAQYAFPETRTPVKTHLDPHYDNVVLNMHMNGPAGSTAFVDEKGKTVTAYGNAALSSTQSKFGGVSAYFDGTGDYLTVPHSTDIDFGSSDFTVELWAYFSAFSTALLGKNTSNSWGMLTLETNSSGNLVLQGSTNGSAWQLAITSSTAVVVSTWNHVAVTRSGDVYRLSLNGVQVGTQTLSGALVSQAVALNIGRIDHTVPRYLNGYIDDVRITKGVARYTSNFTVPALPNPDFKTAPAATDPYWKNVVLHMPMNGADAGTTFVENTGKAVTVNGNTCTKVAQYRFGGSSAYFDGTGDYLVVPNSAELNFGTGDFTIELWFNKSSTSNKGIFHMYPGIPNPSVNGVGVGYDGAQFQIYAQNASNGTGAFTLIAGAWYHLALVRASGSTRLYVNGVQLGSAVSHAANISSNQLNIGLYYSPTFTFDGYIDDLRVTKGVARYTSAFTPPSLPNPTGYDSYAPNVVLHLPMATDFNDGTGKTVTVNGNTVISTTAKKLGTGSGYFDGSGDYLSLADSADWAFGSAAFTIETWVKFSSQPVRGTGATSIHMIACQRQTDSLRWFFGYADWVGVHTGPCLWFMGDAATIAYAPITFTLDTWYHVAIARSGNTFTIYVNGVSIGSGTSAASIGDYSAALSIGFGWNVDFYLHGYLSDLRITKGVARYTANFTPPREPFSLT